MPPWRRISASIGCLFNLRIRPRARAAWRPRISGSCPTSVRLNLRLGERPIFPELLYHLFVICFSSSFSTMPEIQASGFLSCIHVSHALYAAQYVRDLHFLTPVPRMAVIKTSFTKSTILSFLDSFPTASQEENEPVYDVLILPETEVVTFVCVNRRVSSTMPRFCRMGHRHINALVCHEEQTHKWDRAHDLGTILSSVLRISLKRRRYRSSNF